MHLCSCVLIYYIYILFSPTSCISQEFDEAVESHGMEVVVVKKGQLKLYAGQPLSDVEMALRSLIEQS